MTERLLHVRVLFKAPHVRACPRPDRPTRPYPTDLTPTDQLPEVINARLNNAEHDFLTTLKLWSPPINDSYYLSPISSSTGAGVGAGAH